MEEKAMDVQRFITKLDSYYMVNDLDSAERLIEAWTNDAEEEGDKKKLQIGRAHV